VPKARLPDGTTAWITSARPPRLEARKRTAPCDEATCEGPAERYSIRPFDGDDAGQDERTQAHDARRRSGAEASHICRKCCAAGPEAHAEFSACRNRPSEIQCSMPQNAVHTRDLPAGRESERRSAARPEGSPKLMPCPASVSSGPAGNKRHYGLPCWWTQLWVSLMRSRHSDRRRRTAACRLELFEIVVDLRDSPSDAASNPAASAMIERTVSAARHHGGEPQQGGVEKPKLTRSMKRRCRVAAVTPEHVLDIDGSALKRRRRPRLP